MALVKVLTLAAEGIVETEIDAGGGGGGGGAPLTDPQFTAYVGIGTPASSDYALNLVKDLTYQGTVGTVYDSSEAGIMLHTNVPQQTPGANQFTAGIVSYKTVQLQLGTNISSNHGISNVLTSTPNGLRDLANKDFLTGLYNRVIAGGTDAVNNKVGALVGIQNNALTSGANQVIDSVTAMTSSAALTASNSTTTMTGISVGASCPSGATATTVTGIALNLTVTGTYTNCWSLRSTNAAGTMYHAGKIAVGGSSRVPTEQIDVAGYITTTTPIGTDNSTKVATTAYVQNALAGAGVISDGVTAANICDLAMDGTTYINAFDPYKYRKNVGVAQLITAGVMSNGIPQYGGSSSSPGTSGAGSYNSVSLGVLGQATGTTAAGYARFEHKLDGSASVQAYSFYDLPIPNTSVDSKVAASCVHYITTVSDATNAYTAEVTLLGVGPTTNTAFAAGSSGFTLSYSHSVNSGNYVINYRGSDGLVKTLNTAVAPGIGVGNAKRIIAKAHRTAANTATVTINIGGTIYTITDSSFNATSGYVYSAIGARIIKTAGTTSRDHYIRHASLARNFN